MFLAVLAAVPPTLEVPQNDSWAYYQVVERLISGGKLLHLGWNDPTLILQVCWGALFARLFGLSYTSLTISTLVLAWLGIVSLYGILRHAGATRGIAVLGAATMLFSPIYLLASYSFNTDVPYVGLATAATLAFLWGCGGHDPHRFLGAGVLIACAFLVRQTSLFLGAAAAAILPLCWPEARGRTTRWLQASAALLVPVTIACAGHTVWFHEVTNGSWPWKISAVRPFLRQPTGGELPVFTLGVIKDGAGVLLDLALPAVPIAIAGVASSRIGDWRRRSTLIPLVVCLLAAIAMTRWLMLDQPARLRGYPFCGSYVTRYGALPGWAAMPMIGNKADWEWITRAMQLSFAWFAVAFAWVLSDGFRRATDADPRPRLAAATVALGVAQYVPLLVGAPSYDRYSLVLLPAVSTCVVAFSARRASLLAGFVALAILGATSTEWLRAYVDRSRAYWELGTAAVERGIPPEQIYLSIEWEGTHLFQRAVKSLNLQFPLQLETGVPWGPLLHYRYGVTEEPDVDSAVRDERYYRPFLARTPRRVVLLEPDVRP